MAGSEQVQEEEQEQERKADLVLDAGGVKGIGLLGAVLTLVDAGYSFPRIAGTSAGAVVASLVAAYQKAGRDPHELVDVMNNLDYKRFADRSVAQRIGGRLGAGLNLLARDGLHTGNYLVDWLGPELEKVGVTTFSHLAIDDPDGSLADYQSYSLVVHVSDLSRQVLVRLPWDYDRYGRDAGAARIVDAVRASMSIPFYFRPVQVDTGKGTATWADGGLLAGFPITAFDRTDGRQPRWPTWGIKLSGEPTVTRDKPVRNPVGLAFRCLATLRGDWNRYHLDSEGVNRRTIYIDTSGVSPVDFAIDRETRDRLFANGEAAARKFLNSGGSGLSGHQASH